MVPIAQQVIARVAVVREEAAQEGVAEGARQGRREAARRVLHAAIGVEYQRAADPHVGVGIHEARELAQGARMHLRVRVEE